MAFGLDCGQHGKCDKVSALLNVKLAAAGKEVLKGRSLSWWQRDGQEFVNNVHTAPTVKIKGMESVVDVAHLQFLYAQDEGVIVLPVEEWTQEICARAFALHPYLVYSLKTESELKLYNPFPFTSPRVPE